MDKDSQEQLDDMEVFDLGQDMAVDEQVFDEDEVFDLGQDLAIDENETENAVEVEEFTDHYGVDEERVDTSYEDSDSFVTEETEASFDAPIEPSFSPSMDPSYGDEDEGSDQFDHNAVIVEDDPIEDVVMQNSASLENSQPTVFAPEDTDADVVDLLMRWKNLSAVQRASFSSLTREVDVLSELIETNTNALSDKFSALVQATQQQTDFIKTIVTSAQDMSSGDSENSLPNVMRYLESTLSDGIAKVVDLSKQCVKLVYELQDVISLVGETEGMIKKINAINKKANLVALNAKIESSRAGRAGAGFSVVADEMRDMSNLVDAVAIEMSEKMGTITQGIIHGYESLKDVANIDLSENIAAKDRIDGLMAGILEYNNDFGRKLEESAKSSAEVSMQISGLITGFQFQDRASQYMAAINNTLSLLTQFSEDLENVTTQNFPEAELRDHTQAKAMISQILNSLTMGDVRNRFVDSVAANTNLAPEETEEPVNKLANEAAADDDDIELF